MASKTINQENARRMIATSDMLRKDRHEAYQSGRLSVYMEDVVRRLERLQRTGSEDEDPEIYLLTKRKQQIWDNQYLIHHGKLAENKGSYEAGFILQEILGPRPETPLLDNIASAEDLEELERERVRTDAILSDWKTPPGSPWERSEDTTFDTTSLSWDTEDLTPQDEATVPERWDEGEEEAEASQTSTSEVWTTAGEEDEDSLPELVSGSEDSGDSGYEFINTPEVAIPKEKTEEEANKDSQKKRYEMTEEEELESSIDFILNMENPDYKEPTKCIGLTCPLTGEQYYVD